MEKLIPAMEWWNVTNAISGSIACASISHEPAKTNLTFVHFVQNKRSDVSVGKI